MRALKALSFQAPSERNHQVHQSNLPRQKSTHGWKNFVQKVRVKMQVSQKIPLNTKFRRDFCSLPFFLWPYWGVNRTLASQVTEFSSGCFHLVRDWLVLFRESILPRPPSHLKCGLIQHRRLWEANLPKKLRHLGPSPRWSRYYASLPQSFPIMCNIIGCFRWMQTISTKTFVETIA